MTFVKILALLLFIVLVLIAAIHAYWAFGGLWPAATEKELVNTVIGAPNMTSMPSMGSTLVVAFLMLLTAFAALAAGGIISAAPLWLLRVITAGAGAVFFLRGVGGHFFEKVAWVPVEPFATLNRTFYSPLCLVIAAGFFLLALASHTSNEELSI